MFKSHLRPLKDELLVVILEANLSKMLIYEGLLLLHLFAIYHVTFNDTTYSILSLF